MWTLRRPHARWLATVPPIAVGLVLAGCATAAPTPYRADDIDAAAECGIQLVNRNGQSVVVRMRESSGIRDLGLLVPDDRRTVQAFCRDVRVGITAVADTRSGTTLGFHTCVTLQPGAVVRVVLAPLTPGVPDRVCRPVGGEA